MDEPTAALNDAEVEVLHELIRRFVAPGRPASSTSRTGWTSCRRIADRDHGDPRRPLRRHAATTADTTMQEVISHDGRPRARRATRSRSSVRGDREVVLRSRACARKALLDDVSFELRKGEILGFAGLMGAGRTEVARAIVGADPIDAGDDPAARRARSRSATRPTRPSTGSATCPRTASASACCSSRTVNANIGAQRRWPSASPALRLRQGHGDARDVRASYVEHAAHQDAVGRARRRKNLSGGNQQKVVIAKWLRQGLRHPDLRRADARHRRRRQGGDLPAAQRARRRGQVDHHDLVGAARDPADVAPDRRDVRGPRHRRRSTPPRPRRRASCTTRRCGR